MKSETSVIVQVRKTLTLKCDAPNCSARAEFHGNRRWYDARQSGWAIGDREDLAFCPTCVNPSAERT